MRVKAAVARAHRQGLTIEGLDLEEPRADELLVKLVASGIGRADLDAIDGRLTMPLPFVPGSEGAGIVERVGDDVTGFRPGDAVVMSFDFCGHCEACATGRPRACADFAACNLAGRYLDGASPFHDGTIRINGRFFGQSSFATHLVCRATSAHKAPKDAPLELFACLGGEMLSGVGVVRHAFKIGVGDTLVVSGADAIGLAAVMVAKASGANQIVVADSDERRRAIAAEIGADVAVHTVGDLDEIVRSLVADGVDFALETTGAREAREACLACLKRGGTCALVGPPDGTPLDFDDQVGADRPLIVSAESHAPPAVLIEELLALHARGALPLEQLIDFFAFEHVTDALDALRSGRVVKPVLRFPLGGFGEADRAFVEGAAEPSPNGAPEDAPRDADVPQDRDALVKS